MPGWIRNPFPGEEKNMSDIYIHIGEMLARNARMYPNDLPLVERVPSENKRHEITWKQFDEGANRFANGLIKRGIRKVLYRSGRAECRALRRGIHREDLRD
jgi:long-subunit acyl-CoA synthetase (AMP-forming)